MKDLGVELTRNWNAEPNKIDMHDQTNNNYRGCSVLIRIPNQFIEKSCPTFMDKVWWWKNWYEVWNQGCVQFWLHCPFVRFVFTSRFKILNPKVIVLNTGNLQRENSFLFKSCNKIDMHDQTNNNYRGCSVLIPTRFK
jgi:hypothetical protein